MINSDSLVDLMVVGLLPLSLVRPVVYIDFPKGGGAYLMTMFVNGGEGSRGSFWERGGV